MPTTSPFARRLLLGLALPVFMLSAGACGQSEPAALTGPSVSASSSPDTTGDTAGSSSSSTPSSTDAESTSADSTVDAESQPSEHDTVAAQISRPSVKVFADASATSKLVTTLGPATALGSKTTLLVLDQRDDWVHVSLPIRPNGSTGWVPLADVELRSNPMAITVDRATHTLTLTHDGEPILTTTVAIGSKANPTPAGQFYVTDLIDTDAPASAYGPFALGLSGHSDTLTEFAGGDGQLGIHGTDDPSSIGKSVSHGCVRVPNDVVTQLAELVPLGTPVTID